MKRIIFALLLCLFLALAPVADAKTAYQRTALTGGTASALDGIDGASLADGDFAFVMASNVLYSYILDADSGAAESSPGVIAPDSNAGTKRWILQQSYAAAATTSSSGIVELATDAETGTGTATDKVLTPSNLTGMGLLPLGAAGQVLRVNSGASGLEYGTVSSTVPIGHLSGLTVSRKDNDEVYVSGGAIEIGGVLYNSDAQLTVALGGEPLGYGSDLCSGGTASANEIEGTDVPSKAVDDNTGTNWLSAYGGEPPDWWQYQFATGKQIEKLQINMSNWAAKAPTAFTLVASNTGNFSGEEVTLLSVSGVSWSVPETKTWTFRNSNTYTYYRIRITGTVGGGGAALTEVEMMEAVYTLAASTPYYVYADPPSSGTELAAENLIISGTAPSFDSAKGGYYHPTNTDQRAIAHFTTDASGYVPTSPFVHYQPVPQVSSGAQLLSITNLPLNADGETTIYTVPAGVRCVLSYAILVAGADAGSTDLTIGADGAETDWLGTQQLDNLDAEYDAVMLMPVPIATPVKIKSYAAATVIKAVVANQAGGASNTLYLYGMLY